MVEILGGIVILYILWQLFLEDVVDKIADKYFEYKIRNKEIDTQNKNKDENTNE